MNITYEFDSKAMANFDPLVQYGKNPTTDCYIFYELMSCINLISVGVERGMSSDEIQKICKYMACVTSFDANYGMVDFLKAKKDLDIDLLKTKYMLVVRERQKTFHQESVNN